MTYSIAPFYKNEKIAVFIDGAYLYSIARSLDFDIDYRKLLDWIGERGQLLRASYYTVLPEDQDYSPIKPLVDWLDYNGFTVVTKPVKEESQSRKRRSDMNMELAVDAVNMSKNVDHIFLFAGDGDFSYLVDSLKRNGVRATVFGTIQAGNNVTSDELRRRADHFFEMEEIVDVIGRMSGDASAKDENFLPDYIEA